MKKLIPLFFFFTVFLAYGQNKTPQEFGFNHVSLKYGEDNVDILIKSKTGEENIKKPVFFFCQGSQPHPLIKYNEKAVYGVFPFDPDILTGKYHLVIVGKPHIPVTANTETLNDNLLYTESNGKFPKEYSNRNLLSYYVDRNIFIINFLQKQNWVSSNKLIVAGHSEGSTIASKMALKSSKITHLIYAGGNPMGRIMSIIGQDRAAESYSDRFKPGEEDFIYWEEVVKNRNDMDDSQGDTHKATFEFSYPPIEYLEKLKIPVLVSYGTKDWSAPFNDYMRVEFIRKNKRNFTFHPYVGAEHNFFPLTKENEINYDVFNWDKVANDWLEWLNGN